MSLNAMRSKGATIIQRARQWRQAALSEYDSKRVIAAYGVPTTREALVQTTAGADPAARRIGYPVALKACAAGASHKTEKGLVALDLGNGKDLRRAFATLKARAGKGFDGDFLVQEMIRGSRELMIGMVRDPRFGPCVMFGLGGVFSEILQDVVFRVAPLSRRDALEMLRGIRAHRVLDAVRGMKAVDVDSLCHILMAVGQIGLDHPDIAEIDINPLIVRDDKPIAVDALIVLSRQAV